MQAEIKTLPETKLVGMSIHMSISKNKTFELFRTFMPRRKEIINALNADTMDLRVYPEGYFRQFNPKIEFIKYALVEVPNFEQIPEGMESFVLEGGEYAVFHYKGNSSDISIFQYIFTKWLPQSDFVLDQRPHFERLGEKYKPNDPNSEEEIWVPVKPKV